jgi:putative nucleotidyltransferase with HDIG domain
MKTNPTQTIDELITALSFIVDVEGNRKLYHGWRVAVLAAECADNLTVKQRREIFYAALLHDIGAVGLIRHIIYFLRMENKRSQTTLLSHPIISAQLVSTIPKMNRTARLILDHHEWCNGLGYPRGRIERHLPWGSQLLKAADSMDIAMRYHCHGQLNMMKAKLMNLAGKEISLKVCAKAITALKKDKLFHNLLNTDNFPRIFYRIKNRVGQIYIPKGIDVIGRTLEVVAQIIDMKHPFTAGHSIRVARYAMAIALAMKLEHDDVTRIKWAGLIHDIGKLTLPRKILDKPSSLTRKEFTRVKKHPETTQNILEMIPTLREITPIAVSHHEYFDGSGYPLGLKGEESVLGARILTICDAFDAMTSNRPYRKPYTPAQACREIQKLAGIQFDPNIVKTALHILRDLGL